MEYLKRTIVEIGAVRRPEDVGLRRVRQPRLDRRGRGRRHPRAREARRLPGRPRRHRERAARRSGARRRTAASTPTTASSTSPASTATALRGLLGYLPPDDEWEHLLFGRGSADQLGGRRLPDRGHEDPARARARGGAARRDRALATPRPPRRTTTAAARSTSWATCCPGAPPELVPDVVILTEGTGDSKKGALGIYRGQRGRMQIEVVVTGRSCHGSMPWEGLNPLEHGGAIVAEAARRYDARDGFLDHPFLGHGTRTASWAQARHAERLRGPGALHVPLRPPAHDRRDAGAGGAPTSRRSTRCARRARPGCRSTSRCRRYREPTWRGYVADNPQIYRGWLTPEDHPAIRGGGRGLSRGRHAARRRAAGRRAAGRCGGSRASTAGSSRPTASASRCRSTTRIDRRCPSAKRWVVSGDVKHPAMFGIGAGIEQNTHRDRRVRGPARAAARDRGPRPLPERLRGPM